MPPPLPSEEGGHRGPGPGSPLLSSLVCHPLRDDGQPPAGELRPSTLSALAKTRSRAFPTERRRTSPCGAPAHRTAQTVLTSLHPTDRSFLETSLPEDHFAEAQPGRSEGWGLDLDPPSSRAGRHERAAACLPLLWRGERPLPEPVKSAEQLHRRSGLARDVSRTRGYFSGLLRLHDGWEEPRREGRAGGRDRQILQRT